MDIVFRVVLRFAIGLMQEAKHLSPASLRVKMYTALLPRLHRLSECDYKAKR
jgi:hypothetical protein